MRALTLTTGPLDVFGQMALDESVAMAFADACVLRFYRWNGPGVTFGYAQSLQEVGRALPEKAKGWPLARRPTGGGVVVHDDDVTFSCVFPAPQGFRPQRVYAELHGALKNALSAQGLVAELKSGPAFARDYAPSAGGVSSACFSNPVPQDLLGQDGEKLLGGALRRYERVVLYQGSLQFSGARGRSVGLESALSQGLSAHFGVRWTEMGVGEGLLDECEKLARSRYMTEQWNSRF